MTSHLLLEAGPGPRNVAGPEDIHAAQVSPDTGGSVRIVRADSAAAVDAVGWQSLTSNPYESRGWFLAMEEHFRDTRFVYFCAYAGGRLQAILPFYDRHSPLPPTTLTRLAPGAGGGTARLAARLLRHAGLSVLTAGSPYSYYSDPIGSGRFDAALGPAVLDYARHSGTDLLGFRAARRTPGIDGLVRRPCLDHFRLDLPGESVSDYLAAMPHKHRGQRKRELRHGPPLERRPLAGHGALMAAFRAMTAARHEGSADVPGAFYETLARHMGDSAVVVLAGREGDWKGAQLLFETRSGIYAAHIGVRERDGAYFRLFTYPVTRAYELGLRTVHYGPAGEQAKLQRGCRRIPTSFYCRAVSMRARAALAATGLLGRLGGPGGAAQTQDVPEHDDCPSPA